MKKSVFFTMLVAAIGLASCSQTPKSNFKTDVDTLSYMLGVSNTQGLSNYAMLRLGVDSTHLDEFFKGIEEGMKQISAKEKAYVSGLSIGQQVASDMFENINESIFTGDSTMSLNKENYLAGFLDGAKNKSFITPDSANVYSRVKGKEVKERSIANLYSEYKKQNEKAVNALRLEIDLTSDVPIYRQIRDRIVRGAASGALAPGERLPTVRQLAADLGVNPMTVNKAYALLKAEGIIVMDRRRGAQIYESFAQSGTPDDDFDGKASLLLSEARTKGVSKQALLARISEIVDTLYQDGEGSK